MQISQMLRQPEGSLWESRVFDKNLKGEETVRNQAELGNEIVIK